jgi:hypothetical protein
MWAPERSGVRTKGSLVSPKFEVGLSIFTAAMAEFTTHAPGTFVNALLYSCNSGRKGEQSIRGAAEHYGASELGE